MESVDTKYTCPNCNHQFTGNYSPNCGQPGKEFNRPFREIFRDFLDSTFGFETRLLRTIRPLLFKSGFLTSEYMAGRRATYYPPFKLYIFLSIILFTLLELTSGNLLTREIENINRSDQRTAIRDSLSARGIVTDPQEATRILDNKLQDTGEGKKRRTYLIAGDTLRGSEDFLQGVEAARDSLGDGQWFLKQFLDGAVVIYKRPQYAWGMILKRTSQALFLLLPVFALLLKLLYIRSKRYFTQQLLSLRETFSAYELC